MKQLRILAPVLAIVILMICFLLSLTLIRTGDTQGAIYWVLVAIFYRLYVNGEKQEKTNEIQRKYVAWVLGEKRKDTTNDR